ncbi:MAG TPA: hemerythrin domain-containing protein [Pilimelia sp.]|nr:hemerythrin domain-containing protein [Pilimelia sp.]
MSEANAAAGTAADDDVIDLLLAQHARIEELFTVLRAAPDNRTELFDELVRLLAVHETAEEEILHPYARRLFDGANAMVEDRLAEEHTSKEMLARLYDGGVDAPDFAVGLDALRREVLTHAAYEQRYEFPAIRAAADAGTLRTMAAAMQIAESVAPTRPHPGVESTTANLLLGPPMAVFDRARDLFREKAHH